MRRSINIRLRNRYQSMRRVGRIPTRLRRRASLRQEFTKRPRRAYVRRKLFTAAIEPLETRLVLSAGLEISEFLAKNDNGLRDQFQKHEDWIEIHNNSPA